MPKIIHVPRHFEIVSAFRRIQDNERWVLKLEFCIIFYCKGDGLTYICCATKWSVAFQIMSSLPDRFLSIDQSSTLHPDSNNVLGDWRCFRYPVNFINLEQCHCLLQFGIENEDSTVKGQFEGGQSVFWIWTFQQQYVTVRHKPIFLILQ